MHRKLARTTKILQNFWLALEFITLIIDLDLYMSIALMWSKEGKIKKTKKRKKKKNPNKQKENKTKNPKTLS